MKDIEFGSFLYKLYHDSVKLETYRLRKDKDCQGLTVNELNLIECIHTLTSGSTGPTISSIADELGITRPSTTVAVNKLSRKQIVTKIGSESDGRSVRVTLTEKGEKAYKAHVAYQKALVKEIKSQFSDNDYGVFVSDLEKVIAHLEDELLKESEKNAESAKSGEEKGTVAKKRTTLSRAKKI